MFFCEVKLNFVLRIRFNLYNDFSVVDAWGKLPSAFLDGNLYELGGFSECLNIEWNSKPYQSKYCLGAISLDVKKKQARVSYQFDNVNNGLIPNLWPSNDADRRIESRAMMPQ